MYYRTPTPGLDFQESTLVRRGQEMACPRRRFPANGDALEVLINGTPTVVGASAKQNGVSINISGSTADQTL